MGVDALRQVPAVAQAVRQVHRAQVAAATAVVQLALVAAATAVVQPAAVAVATAVDPAVAAASADRLQAALPVDVVAPVVVASDRRSVVRVVAVATPKSSSQRR